MTQNKREKDLEARIAELEAKLAKAERPAGRITCKIPDGGKGTLCFYGVNTRAPISFYPTQLVRFLQALPETVPQALACAKTDAATYWTPDDKKATIAYLTAYVEALTGGGQ